MGRLRVSAINYLNTAPLMWDFEHGGHSNELRKQFEIDYTIPSRCAQMLAEGSVDIGIIPVAAYATIPNLKVLPDVAIASKRAVGSILLMSRRPLEEIRTVALDSSSRSSAVLVQILFAKHWKQEAQFSPALPDLERMLDNNDGALLIGDPALQVDRSQYRSWDLGTEWQTFTGRPFVFAFWAVRSDAASDEEFARMAEVFRDSRDAGLRHIDSIAPDWSKRIGLSPERISSYLKENIYYYLDEECVAGLELFFRHAAELELLPRAPELRLVRELEFRNSGSNIRF